MPADERDSQFERALLRHLSGASGDSACPDAEILAAYHERSLSVEELARWKEHMAACARCQEALSLVEQSETVLTAEEQNQHELEPVAQLTAAAGPAPVHRLRPRAAWSWIVSLGAVAAGAIVLVGVHEIRSQRVKETQVALERLPAPLPAPPQASAKEELKKEEAPVARTPNGPSVGKPIASASNVSALQSPALASPPARKESAQSAQRDSSSAKGGVIAGLEPAPSVSSYAADAQALQTNALPAPKPAPPVPAAPNVSSQQSEENKKVQFSKTRIAGQLQAPAAAPTMTSAEVVALPTDNLVQTALTNRRYIVALGENHAWRLGDRGLIETSTDHGKTWKPQSSGVSTDLTAGSATSDEVCWVVGKSGTLLLTVDGGKHWNQIASPIAADLGGVHASDASHASIWDVSNRVSFETNDGGVTWQRIANE